MKEVIFIKNNRKFNVNSFLEICRKNRIEVAIRNFCSNLLVYTDNIEAVLKILGEEKSYRKGILWNIEEIDEVASILSEYVKDNSFAILVEKNSSNIRSRDLSSSLGTKIVERCGATVDLSNPKVRICLMICGKEVFTHLYFSPREHILV